MVLQAYRSSYVQSLLGFGGGRERGKRGRERLGGGKRKRKNEKECKKKRMEKNV